MAGRRTILLVCVAVILLLTGTYVWWSHPHQQAKRSVKTVLLDPNSAMFDHLETCRDGDQVDYVSGYVNSKNSLGGYVGDRFFVAYFTESGTGAVEIQEGDDDDRSVAAWVKYLQSRKRIAEALGGVAQPTSECGQMDDLARQNSGMSTLEDSYLRLQSVAEAARSQ